MTHYAYFYYQFLSIKNSIKEGVIHNANSPKAVLVYSTAKKTTPFIPRYFYNQSLMTTSFFKVVNTYTYV